MAPQQEPPPLEQIEDTPTPQEPSNAVPTPSASPSEDPPSTAPEVTAPWVRHYGGKGFERILALASDSSGGFVAGGLFGDAPFPLNTGFALARYDSTGAPVWVRQVTTDDVWLNALTVTPEGNILAVGNYRGTPNLGTGALPEARLHLGTGPYSGVFVAKFSPSGQIVWSQGFVATYLDRDSGRVFAWSISADSVATDANGSLIVAGNFHGQVNFGTGTLYAGNASTYGGDPYPGGFVAKFTWQGQPVWSKAFEATPAEPLNLVRTVATDTSGNVLVGGRAGGGANLGDGPLPYASAFIVKYTPAGGLLWKRLFGNTYGEVTAVRAFGVDQVVFNANLGGTFFFAGQEYFGGDPEDQGYPLNRSGYTGALTAQGADRWIRDQGRVTLNGLVTDAHLTVTLTGYKPHNTSSHFIARYNNSGVFLWNRSFDGGLAPYDTPPRLLLAPQPGSKVVVGSDFFDSIHHEGTVYSSRGNSDLFYFQITP
ncbi:hypothetical protein POL68_04105 [Stigmatella sp. ncwal1]|uniref:Uncharacterized protein n=1 Tax=Stigmatella ashevillensis TaxID=2995309 RepID=A0ABT5D1V6_9BACT|nr:hypothetical protein [Stigmatella ashevillena]MDC0707644.1 hypothetical protein [Stigmatella ashevillena]